MSWKSFMLTLINMTDKLVELASSVDKMTDRQIELERHITDRQTSQERHISDRMADYDRRLAEMQANMNPPHARTHRVTIEGIPDEQPAPKRIPKETTDEQPRIILPGGR